MDPQYPAFGTGRLFHLARQLERAGQPYAIATVVHRRPPVSAQVGDKALITADGQLVGWVGGRCSQPVVRREAAAAIRAGQPRLLRLTGQPEELAAAGAAGVTTVPMTCPSGGEVEIYIEPYLRRPRLVAVGPTPLVRALGLLGPVVGFDVTLVAERPEELESQAAWSTWMSLADFATADFPAATFFVVASAGHYDEEALLRALQTPSPYVALVASRRRAEAVFEVLRGSGCPEEQVGRIRTPAGLDIGAATQEEIALAVLAEVVAHYRRGTAAAERIPLPAAAPEPEQELVMAAPVLARDPVCGMEVEVAGARHMTEHAGQTYYFCCPHCRQRFIKEPGRYLDLSGQSGAMT